MTSDHHTGGHLVICGYCHMAYNLWDVVPTHRYADCTMWNAPCCGKQTDDRPWRSVPSYTELTDQHYVTSDGRIFLVLRTGVQMQVGRMS